jgi:hypothetical protein
MKNLHFCLLALAFAMPVATTHSQEAERRKTSVSLFTGTQMLNRAGSGLRYKYGPALGLDIAYQPNDRYRFGFQGMVGQEKVFLPAYGKDLTRIRLSYAFLQTPILLTLERILYKSRVVKLAAGAGAGARLVSWWQSESQSTLVPDSSGVAYFGVREDLQEQTSIFPTLQGSLSGELRLTNTISLRGTTALQADFGRYPTTSVVIESSAGNFQNRFALNRFNWFATLGITFYLRKPPAYVEGLY